MNRVSIGEATALDYRRSTLAELKKRLDLAEHEIVCSAEVMVGRDTYPLIDESASPFDLYICIEIERLLGSIRHLTDNIHNEITTIEISAPEVVIERRKAERRGEEGPGAQFSKTNLGSDRRCNMSDRRRGAA